MPTLQEITEQIKKVGNFDPSSFLVKKEVSELPNILNDDEIIEKAVMGLYDKGNGIIIATNKRCFFLNKGMMWGSKMEDFPYDKISSIQYETGLIFGTIKIFTSGNQAVIEQVDKNCTKDFCEYVRNRITKIHTATTPTVQENSKITEDPLETLSKLKRLLEADLITEEEYNAKKAEILSRM